MADNKVELNAENLEGVAGGAAVENKNIDKRDVVEVTLKEGDPGRAGNLIAQTPEEILKHGDPRPNINEPTIEF